MMQTLQEEILDALGTTFSDDLQDMSLEDLDMFCMMCVTGGASHELLQRKLGLERQGRTGMEEARRCHHFSRRSDVYVDEDVFLGVVDVSH